MTTSHPASTPRRRIAVVDDEESVRKALRRLLAAFDLDATTFASGRDFLDALTERRPDCLVLDLQMRAPNGFDVLAELAASGARLPVVIITAHDEPETVRLGLHERDNRHRRRDLVRERPRGKRDQQREREA